MLNSEFSIIPQANIKIFQLLYLIEVGIRELIIEVLSKRSPTWYKQSLPAGILKTYKEAKTYERSNPWIQYIPHHPMYYLDFPDLAAIIDRTENWENIKDKGNLENTFKAIFARRDVTVNTLRELEPIRNKVAHNRKATSEDLCIVQSAFEKLSASIGKEHFLYLANKCTTALELRGRFEELKNEIAQTYNLCLQCKELSSPNVFISIENEWWFDSEYLGYDLNSLRDYYQLLGEYRRIPRHIGVGHLLEQWVHSNHLEQLYIKASTTLEDLLEGR